MTSVRTFFVRASLVCALLLPAFFVATAMATKSGLLDWRTGFGVLTLMVGPLLVAACLIVATAALALTAIVRPRRGWRAALLALAAPAIGAGWLLDMRAQAARAPPIHDISTDLLDPPGFSADVQAERAMVAGSNSLDLMRKRVPALGGRFDDQAGRLVRELQEESYPDIRPIPVGVPAARALAACIGAGRRLNWSIDRVDARAGIIEARVTSFWYGFTDDVVVRITPADPGAVIDVRSVSRVGVSDLGANAKRVRAFSDAVARELDSEARPTG